MTWHGIPLPTDGRADWLAQRKVGIGASDVAGILGLSPWATPYTVWADKTHDLEDDQNEAMRWGSLLEDVVVDEFAARSGLSVHGRQWLVRHPDYEWAMATLDGLAFESPVIEPEFYTDDIDVFDPLGVVEVKTDSQFGAFKDGVPDHYRIQVMWQMFVTGLEHTWIAVLHGGRNFQVYEVEYDQELLDVIFKRVSEFRDRHIVGDEMPDPDGSEATARIVNDLWAADGERVIELASDAAADLESLRGWKDELERVEAEVRRLETRVKTVMQEATVGTVGGVAAVTWKQVDARRADPDAMRAAGVFDQYSKASSYRQFLLKKERET